MAVWVGGYNWLPTYQVVGIKLVQAVECIHNGDDAVEAQRAAQDWVKK